MQEVMPTASCGGGLVEGVVVASDVTGVAVVVEGVMVEEDVGEHPRS